jgi:hypothetical protein
MDIIHNGDASPQNFSDILKVGSKGKFEAFDAIYS